MITISIDAMGGDHGLETTVPAAIEIANGVKDVQLILVGDVDKIQSRVERCEIKPVARLDIRHASQVVEMDESPASALRKKKDSSMRVAINLVESGEAQACVSAGNTGALMATAKFVLKTIDGIDRPAICGELPRADGSTFMLDLGANIDTPPQILLQFGLMGSQLIECLMNNQNPSVGLLNIGIEEIKGNESIRATAQLFKQSKLNYTGFVEADEIFFGQTDLIVCDGVLGNIALKTSEGVVQMISRVMKDEFAKSARTRISAFVAKPVLGAFKNRLDHRRYNGATLLGLKGTVIKSHGGADSFGFAFAIKVAAEEVRKNLVSKIQSALSTSNIHSGVV